MTDEPTNFMIFPCAFLVEFSKSDFENSIAHMIGLIVYKKNNNFVVMKVDKQEMFDGNQLPYLEFSKENIENLRQLLFSQLCDLKSGTYV